MLSLSKKLPQMSLHTIFRSSCGLGNTSQTGIGKAQGIVMEYLKSLNFFSYIMPHFYKLKKILTQK